jgi:hypothetical protein
MTRFATHGGNRSLLFFTHRGEASFASTLLPVSIVFHTHDIW